MESPWSLSRAEAAQVWKDVYARHALEQEQMFSNIGPYNFGEWAVEDGQGWYMSMPSDLRDTSWIGDKAY